MTPPAVDGSPTTRVHYAGLAAILVAAAVLRTAGASSEGLWLDEGLTLVLAQWPLRDMLLQPTDPSPALYYYLHQLLIPADASLRGIRAISIASGVVSVALIYVLGRLSLGARAGLIAAALLAVWTTHVDYSQEARAYSLLFMLTLVSSIGVVAYARAGTPGARRLALALFGAGNVLSFYTHLTGAFWIAVTSLLVLGIALHARRPRLEVGCVFVAMAVLALPGLYRMTRLGVRPPDFNWLAQPGVQGFADGILGAMGPIGYWENRWIGSGRTVVKLALVATGILALGGALWRWGARLPRYPAAWLVAAYLVVPVLLWAIGCVSTPVFMRRTVLFAAPGPILLIAGLCAVAPLPRLAAATVAGIYLGSTLLYGPMREKPDLRGATRFLEAAAGPRDVVAVCASYAYPALRYHAQTVAGGVVLGAAWSGGLIRLEHGLGADPAWERTYFRTQVYRMLYGRSVRESGQELPVAPGQVLWRVDYHCGEASGAYLDETLERTGFVCAPAWREPRALKRSVEVTRCVSSAAGALRILVREPVRPAAQRPLPDRAARRSVPRDARGARSA